VHVVQAPQLGDRRGVVLDAQVDEHVARRIAAARARDDLERGGLLPADVAARGLGPRRARRASARPARPRVPSKARAMAATTPSPSIMLACALKPPPVA
jgi:hypothetical protein